MAKHASAKRPRETWKDWCAPDKRGLYVTRGELLFWIDRVETYRKDAKWYRALWRWACALPGRVLDDINRRRGFEATGSEP